MHTSAEAHINSLDVFAAVILMLLFVASSFFSLKGDKTVVPSQPGDHKHKAWPLTLII